jgi:hypothetical protein
MNRRPRPDAYDTDNSLWEFLAGQLRDGQGELPCFIENIARARIFELEVKQAKAENCGECRDIIEAAVTRRWSRNGATERGAPDGNIFFSAFISDRDRRFRFTRPGTPAS